MACWFFYEGRDRIAGERLPMCRLVDELFGDARKTVIEVTRNTAGVHVEVGRCPFNGGASCPYYTP